MKNNKINLKKNDKKLISLLLMSAPVPAVLG